MKFREKFFKGIIIIVGISFIGISYFDITKQLNISKQDNSKLKLDLKVNEEGKTYGSNLLIEDSTMDENGNPNELDLILVEADNGKIGYVTKEDFYDIENQPKNPKEAVEYMKRLKLNGERTISVYDKDGKTIVGSYKIGSK